MSCSSCQGLYSSSIPCSVCNGVPQPAPVPLPDCTDPNAEICEEAIDSQCVIYSGNNLTCLGFNISQDGPVRYDEIIQAIDTAVCNSNIGVISAASGSPCILVTGTGAVSNPLTINIKIDSEGGISCGPNGLRIGTGGGIGGLISLAPNSGLVWNPSGSSTLDTLYDTLQTGNSVQLLYNGGSVASQPATVWKTKTIVEVLDAILFPTRIPEYVKPTASISGFTPSNPYEIGASLSFSLSASATHNDGGGFNAIRVVKVGTPSPVCSYTATFPSTPATPTAIYGIVSSYQYLLPNGTLGTAGTPINNTYQPTACGPISYTVSAPTGSNTTSTASWKVEADYVLGPVKLDSSGATSGSALPAGTASSPLVTVTGLYPIFYGKIDPVVASLPLGSSTLNKTTAVSSAITALNSSLTKKRIAAANGNITIDYVTELNGGNNINDNWMWVAVPKYNPNKTKIVTSWTSSLPVAISPAQSWSNLGTITVTAPSSSNWGTYDYTIYMTNYPTVANSGYTELQN